MFLRELILSPLAAFAYSLPSTRSSVLLLNAGLCPFAESEEYATREKNGIYKPHDHYLEEATEKKALTEKVKKLELDLDSNNKQLVELWEHYGFQQQFSAEVNNKFERIEQLAGLQELCCSHEQRSAELREKLERTEKKLEGTEHSLSDLKEKYRLVNEEKENLKSDLVRSGKAIDKAAEREREFENATLYISSVLACLRATPNAREKELVEEPTCSTMRKSHFNLPTVASIEELKSPAFEELLKTLWNLKFGKQVNGNVKHIIPGAHDGLQSL